MELGLHIEKGYEVKEAIKRTTELMKKDWDWYDSNVRIQRGELDEVMKTLSVNLGTEVYSKVTCQTKYDKGNKIYGYHVVNGKDVTDFKKYESLDTLPQLLKFWSDSSFYWVNLYVYTSWTKTEFDDLDDFEDFYDKTLAPFQHWVSV